MKSKLFVVVALILMISMCLSFAGCDEYVPPYQEETPMGGSSGSGNSPAPSTPSAGNDSATTEIGTSSEGNGGNDNSVDNANTGENGSNLSGQDNSSNAPMTLSIRNLYFSNWSAEQGDSITQYIEDKFNLKLQTSSYEFNNWAVQINADVMGAELPDVFQANVTSYNLQTTFLYWAEGDIIKALPDDLSRWPYLKSMIDGTRDIECLKYGGKLYGIPIARNVDRSAQASFAPFTYLYRRDIAKSLGVYQEGDVYTWEQFENLLAAFYSYFQTQGGYALGDAEWAYPSVTNFYKTASHCFATDESGNVVNNFLTPEYIQGLEKAKAYVNDNLYYRGQLQSYGKQNLVKKEYTSKRLGIFYENLSLSNYLQIRDEFIKNGVAESALDDYTAIMKVMGPDGKYALEEQEDWYSMTFFNADISDREMARALDLMNWLLSPEGTTTALYGIEGVDYEREGDEVKLLDGDLWAKNARGEYVDSPNGARYLRYMVTLGEDIESRDPLVLNSASKSKAYQILSAWNGEMQAALASGNLKILAEDPAVKWMQTEKKTECAGRLLDDATTMVYNYTFGRKSLSEYQNVMTSSRWTEVLAEINATLNSQG